jgi:hypothetical protein
MNMSFENGFVYIVYVEAHVLLMMREEGFFIANEIENGDETITLVAKQCNRPSLIVAKSNIRKTWRIIAALRHPLYRQTH